MKGTVLSALGVLAFMSSLIAQSPQPAGEGFSWHGELVALDESARIMTVKTPVVGDALTEFARLKSGERVTLTWSGYDKFADAIRQVRSGVVNKPEERFTFPVEFVSFDESRRYATFKVQIPDTSIANLKPLKPGEWVTAMSPHGPSSKSTPVQAVRPYVERATASASN